MFANTLYARTSGTTVGQQSGEPGNDAYVGISTFWKRVFIIDSFPFSTSMISTVDASVANLMLPLQQYGNSSDRCIACKDKERC